MATVINNPEPSRPTIVDSNSGAGWAVAIIILLLLIAGGTLWYFRHRVTVVEPVPTSGTQQTTQPSSPSATVNVTLPNSTTTVTSTTTY